MERFIVFPPFGDAYYHDDVEYDTAYPLETYIYDRFYYKWYCAIKALHSSIHSGQEWLFVPESHVPKQFLAQLLIFT